MDLFEFIDTLFSKEKYAIVPDSIKNKHFFMTQRFMSIRYPMEANNFNVIGINQVIAMDFWHMILAKRFTKKPFWIFTKTKKSKDKEKSHKIEKMNLKLVNFYLKNKKMDRRDFEFLKEIYPDKLHEELKRIEKTVKDNSIKI